MGPPHTSVWGAGADEVGEPLHGPPQLLLQRQHILHLLPPRQRHRPALHGLRGQRGLNGSTCGAEDPPRGAEDPPRGAEDPPLNPPPPPKKAKLTGKSGEGCRVGGGSASPFPMPTASVLNVSAPRPRARPRDAMGRGGGALWGGG